MPVRLLEIENRKPVIDKIKSAMGHLEAIGIDDYARAAPGVWRI
ncbi:hypothetical protein [Jonesia denitrificans]|uniref:Uncharacterized protein n=1 Tax=Jonesia denitrificans (strain ATCC 14870 / DSM 20603 / BCRC 15368 / CIP 55.134 / JCM 11481 / NBRC 15587 / NCTC 10816 / Prevot 55134) TaxID=471856 RepID=C7R1Z9_JONDD|nr:hypothetical protein [Jonesia denitrificans]ACV09887.1 hypothetical protein Jden_2252 [Jonesia denitrificans DSM 20603]SQH22587.1 Uncharacterised protein [Jonesia denitrificans]